VKDCVFCGTCACTSTAREILWKCAT